MARLMDWGIRYLQLMVNQRVYYAQNTATSGTRIDADAIKTVSDLPWYLPRALVVGFALPVFWQHDAARPAASRIAMSLAGLEMALIDFALAGLLFRLWQGRGPERANMLFLIGFCSLLIVVNVYATPNLGTLHRVRYAPLILLATLGWAAWIDFFARRRGSPY